MNPHELIQLNGVNICLGTAAYGKTYRKPLRKSQPIREEDEDPGDGGLKEEGPTTAVCSGDISELQGESCYSIRGI